jgi:DNA-nicking Smr family endonuclease
MITALSNQGDRTRLTARSDFFLRLAAYCILIYVRGTIYIMHGKNVSSKDFSVRPFEKLKKRIASSEAVLTTSSACRKKKEQFTDEELFSRAMSEVQEIRKFRELSCAHGQKKAAPCRERKDPDQEALTILCEIAEGRRSINLPDTQEYVEWTNPDYQGDLAQQMHEGQFSIQTFLDLHGHTVAEADVIMEAFVKDSLSKGLSCIKIIHGRGLRSVKGPQVKGVVIKRLSGHFRKNIIAFVTARQCDGGLGALYVLLKKR